ncbi:hypothetical protein L2E82_19060 [Cichorium intybus]|uniref:Uncharacterized protein n=1 Tax=Cichorium intybus TaxID=13427 RepID=A0ACB9FCP2_CICIN|nr:hypothetical protein L2E82_19060 [Cichorium intybus]
MAYFSRIWTTDMKIHLKIGLYRQYFSKPGTMNDQQQQPPQPPELQPPGRKKRTATQLKNSEEPQEIDFNHNGQHSGDNQIGFRNECGVLTRSHISINYQTWKKVPKAERDMLWLTIKRRWKFQNNEHKEDVLKVCNTAWKSFKKRLKRDFMDKERDPLPIFPYLDPGTWEKFKAERYSKEFKVISDKARANAKLQKNPARLGPHGYQGKRAQWEKDIASGGLASELYKIKSQRSRDYVMGRLSKDESGSYKTPPNIQPILTELVDVEAQISQGDWVPGPGEDSLTAVLGREHPGWTRGVGHTVGVRKAMLGFDQNKKKMQDKEAMDEMRAKMENMTNRMEDMTNQITLLKTMIQESRKQVDVNVSSEVQNGSRDSTSALDSIMDPTPCELMLPYGAMDQKCATGLVFPYGNGLIHSLPLSENHLKVMIDQINTKFQVFPVPVATDEVNDLQGAVGQIIQWPRNGIVLTKAQRGKQPVLSSNLPQPTVGGGIKKNTPIQMNNKSRAVEALREQLKNIPLIRLVADYGVLEAGTFEFWVARDEIFCLLNKEKLDITIITVWQMILHSVARMKNKCAFLNPHRIHGTECQENPENVISYLVEAMRIYQGKQFLVAPYLQSEHWVLLVICTRNRTGYILDSLRSPTLKPVDTYYLLKKHVDTAFARYGKDISNPISWTLAECNQQPGDWECGYYVMKWMLDFVMSGQHGFLSRTATPWNDETSFS